MNELSDRKKPELVAEDQQLAESRKTDHIELAFAANLDKAALDTRFNYEPLLSAHPIPGQYSIIPFLGKSLRSPIWVSSMTGGAKWAHTINTRLATACQKFGMGMGLGSCRSLLYGDEHLRDFDVRHLMGPDLPLFANLGIAQVEDLQDKEAMHLIPQMLKRLQADGLILHLNPMQEWFQPEGDRLKRPPLQTLRRLVDQADYPIIVKEVGQGMGPESLRFLMHMPLAAVDFGAAGGTNFALLENLRRSEDHRMYRAPLVRVGHDATAMVDLINEIVQEYGQKLSCGQIIISGGVKDFLDGFYLMEKCALPALYGQASALLKYARESQEALDTFLQAQTDGLAMARAYLRIKTS
jgi:isopentenyl-diphosphate delta-isomerase